VGEVGDVTRIMVRVLDEERLGLSFRCKCVPYGSFALIEPRRDERRHWVRCSSVNSVGDSWEVVRVAMN
jgi:hypothetical protein